MVLKWGSISCSKIKLEMYVLNQFFFKKSSTNISSTFFFSAFRISKQTDLIFASYTYIDTNTI